MEEENDFDSCKKQWKNLINVKIAAFFFIYMF